MSNLIHQEGGLNLHDLAILNSMALLNIGCDALQYSSLWGSLPVSIFFLRLAKKQDVYLWSFMWHGLKCVFPILNSNSHWFIGDEG